MDTEQEIKQLKIMIMIIGLTILLIIITQLIFINIVNIVKEDIDDITTHLINSKYDVQEMYRYFNITQPSTHRGFTIT